MDEFIKSYSFTLDDWQHNACKTIIEDKQNVLVTAHTGCGKTIIAEGEFMAIK